MAAQAGKDFLLKSGDGANPEVFTTIGGLRSTSLSINGEEVDITNQGSQQWKELLDGAGIVSMSVSGSGVFTNSAAENLALTRCLGRTLANYQVSDGIRTFTGKFKITKMERAGEYKGEQTWSVSLASSGAIVIA